MKRQVELEELPVIVICRTLSVLRAVLRLSPTIQRATSPLVSWINDLVYGNAYEVALSSLRLPTLRVHRVHVSSK